MGNLASLRLQLFPQRRVHQTPKGNYDNLDDGIVHHTYLDTRTSENGACNTACVVAVLDRHANPVIPLPRQLLRQQTERACGGQIEPQSNEEPAREEGAKGDAIGKQDGEQHKEANEA